MVQDFQPQSISEPPALYRHSGRIGRRPNRQPAAGRNIGDPQGFDSI
jgi:hypothetical protein